MLSTDVHIVWSKLFPIVFPTPTKLEGEESSAGLSFVLTGQFLHFTSKSKQITKIQRSRTVEPPCITSQGDAGAICYRGDHLHHCRPGGVIKGELGGSKIRCGNVDICVLEERSERAPHC